MKLARTLGSRVRCQAVCFARTYSSETQPWSPQTKETQRRLNDSFLVKNKDSIESNFKDKLIAIQDGRMVLVTDNEGELNEFINKNEHKGVITFLHVGSDGNAIFPIDKPHTNVLFMRSHVAPPHSKELVPLPTFQPEALFVNTREKRPYTTLPLRLKAGGLVYPVTFLLDTGSPFTFLMPEVVSKLGIPATSALNSGLSQYKRNAYVYGEAVSVYESGNHYRNINLLGTDVLWKLKSTFHPLGNLISLEHPTNNADGTKIVTVCDSRDMKAPAVATPNDVIDSWSKVLETPMDKHFNM